MCAQRPCTLTNAINVCIFADALRLRVHHQRVHVSAIHRCLALTRTQSICACTQVPHSRTPSPLPMLHSQIRCTLTQKPNSSMRKYCQGAKLSERHRLCQSVCCTHTHTHTHALHAYTTSACATTGTGARLPERHCLCQCVRCRALDCECGRRGVVAAAHQQRWVYFLGEVGCACRFW